MFERTFEERKDAIEQGKCSCLPDNEVGLNCLKNCKHRKIVVERMEGEDNIQNNSDEQE